MNRVETIVLNKKQTALIVRDGSNGVAPVSGDVSTIAAVLAASESVGCRIVFDTYAAPNFKRCFNAYVKRAKLIAALAGVQLSEPSEYSIDGFPQRGKYCLEVIR